MKLIAQTGNGNFLAEISAREVANIRGLASDPYRDGDDGKQKACIGMEINVEKFFGRFETLASKKGMFRKVSKELIAIAKILDEREGTIPETL